MVSSTMTLAWVRAEISPSTVAVIHGPSKIGKSSLYRSIIILASGWLWHGAARRHTRHRQAHARQHSIRLRDGCHVNAILLVASGRIETFPRRLRPFGQPIVICLKVLDVLGKYP